MKTKRHSRLPAAALAFVLVLGMFMVMPQRAEAAAKKSRLVKNIVVYNWDAKTKKWKMAGKESNFGKNYFKVTYDKHGNIKTIDNHYYSSEYKASVAYTYSKAGRKKSAVVKWTSNGWGKATYRCTYNSKGLRSKTTGAGETYSYKYKNGYVSDYKFTTEDSLETRTITVRTRSNGLIKSAVVKEKSGMVTRYAFNKKGLMTRAAVYDDSKAKKPSSKTAFTYKFNKNGTVKSVVAKGGDLDKMKYVYSYAKKKASRRKANVMVNYPLYGYDPYFAVHNEWLMPVM